MNKEEDYGDITKTQYRVGMGAIALASGAMAAYAVLNYGLWGIPQTLFTAVPIRSLVKEFLG